MIFQREILRTEMRRYKMSMADLMRRLQRYDQKASRALVHYWVRGEKSPSMPYVMALCEIFNKKVEDFYK